VSPRALGRVEPSRVGFDQSIRGTTARHCSPASTVCHSVGIPLSSFSPSTTASVAPSTTAWEVPSPVPPMSGGSSRRKRASSRLTETTLLLLSSSERSRRQACSVAAAGLLGRDYGLSSHQTLAIEQVTISGRVPHLLVGLVGTGRSTTIARLRAAWEVEYGNESVVDLALTVAAAEPLADEIRIEPDNTASWPTEWRSVPKLAVHRDHTSPRASPVMPSIVSCRAGTLGERLEAADRAITERRLQLGRLAIMDEAPLAGTFALDEIVGAAQHAGAKVLLVGD